MAKAYKAYKDKIPLKIVNDKESDDYRTLRGIDNVDLRLLLIKLFGLELSGA